MSLRGMLDYYIWQVRFIMYGNLYFSFLGLYSLNFIRPPLVLIIYSFLIYKDSLSLSYIYIYIYINNVEIFDWLKNGKK